MSWIARIKNFFYQRAVTKTASPETVRKIMNFDKVKTVGIVADLSLAKNESVIAQLTENLTGKGKTVSVLAFINDKKAAPVNGITIFTPNEVNWFDVPDETAVSFFVNEPFDVLLCPFAPQNKPLNFVAAAAQAHCRVGVYDSNGTNNYELMVQLNEETPLEDITAQMLRLLQQINTETI